jgi:hypothetical protein
MDYFLVYHRAKQRAILRNGNMDHFTFIDRTPFEEILKVQKPLSIMDLNCQYVVWQDIKLLAINKIFNRKSTKFCSHSYI